MAFSTLTANPDIMRAGNESITTIASMDDTALQASQRTAALAHLKSDVIRACGLRESDTARLDELTDNNAETLALALGYLQLYLIFQTDWAGTESVAAAKVAEYRKMYSDVRGGFAAMRTTEAIMPVRSTRVTRS